MSLEEAVNSLRSSQHAARQHLRLILGHIRSTPPGGTPIQKDK